MEKRAQGATVFGLPARTREAARVIADVGFSSENPARDPIASTSPADNANTIDRFLI